MNQLITSININSDQFPDHDLQSLHVRLQQLEQENEQLKQQLQQQDITLQKHTQIYNFAPICFLRINKQGQICRANSQTTKLFNKTESELLSTTFQSFLQLDSLPIFLNFLSETFQSHKAIICELDLYLSESFASTILVNGIVPEDEHTCFLALRDITEEKKSKQALIKSHQKYVELTDNLPVGIFETDANGLITYRNNRAKEWFGHTDEEIATALSYLTCVVESEQQRIIQNFCKNLYSEDNLIEEYTALNKNSKEFPIQVQSFGIFNNNEIVGVRGIIINLAEQKRSEEQLKQSEEWFRETLDNMMEGYQLIDFDWRYRYLNPTALTYSQKTTDELIGNTIMDIYPDIMTGAYFQSLKKAMNERVTVNVENKFTYQDGTTYWFELRIKPVPTGIAILSIDISERKKAEQTLLEYSEKLRKEVEKQTTEIRLLSDLQDAILNHSGLAIISLSQEGIILDFNSAAERLTGYTAAEVVGKRSPSIFNDMKKIRETAKDVGYLSINPNATDEELIIDLTTKYLRDTIECEFIRKDKSSIPILLNTTALKNEQGEITGHVGFALDNTERSYAEARLRMQSAAFESFALSVIITDKDGNIQWINPAFTQLTGYTTEEALGQNPNILKSGKHTPEFYKGIWETILSGKVWNGEIINKRKNGSFYYQECTITPVVDQMSKITNFIALQVDVSYRKKIEQALRESEERWQFALDGSGLGVWDWNTQTNEEFFSAQWKKMLGYDEDEISNSAEEWLNRVHPDDLEKCYTEMDLYLSGQKEIYANEHRLKCKDGSFKWIFTRGKIVEMTEDGKPLRIIGTHSDITEQKISEEKLLQTLKQEKELNELKSRFVSTTSHEFRTPLSSILLACDLLLKYRDKMDESKMILRFERIKDQTLHLSKIVEDILQLSKLQDGKMTFNPESIELVSLCRNFVDIFNDEHLLQNKILFTSFKQEINIQADNRLMRQILNNLLSNAIKYSPENPFIKLDIDQSRQNILLKIQDNGIGIPIEEQKHLFNPFFRASNASLIQGNGLGLSIIKEAIALHGGNISVESNVHTGTTFIIELPESIMQ